MQIVEVLVEYVNEIRKLENMNPIPNGDIYLQPSNFIEAGTKLESVKQ